MNTGKRPSAILQHELDDLFVGADHADASQLTDVLDRVFHALDDDAVAAHKFLAVEEHLVAEYAGVNAGGDLGGAGGFGSVADDAGDDGQGIDDGMDDIAVGAAVEIGDTGSGSRPGTDGAAVGRQTAERRP